MTRAPLRRHAPLLAALGLLTAAGPAAAIPVFARRYQTACTTCHVLPPKLNPFGLAFRANGFRMPAGERPRQEKDVQLGVPEWEELFPRAILPGTVSDVPPIAGMLYGALEADRGSTSTESAIAAFTVLAAGNLGDRASWFAAAGASSQGSRLERVQVSFDKLAGTWLGARAGYLEPAAVPFSRYTHRLSYEGYLPYEEQGPAKLALSTSRPALELFGAGADPSPLRGLQYAVGAGTRNVTGGLSADVWGRVSYKLGGVAAAGDSAGEPGRIAPAVAPLDEQSLRLGVSLYKSTLAGPAARARAWRAGGDAELLWGRWELLGAALAGGDSASDGAPESSSWSFLAGAGARPWPWLYLLARYEAGWLAGSGAQRRLVTTIRAALQQNVAVSGDFVVEMPDADSTETVLSVFLAF